MKKSTKGALAAAAAGTLLVGGTGSLAYWTATQDVTGGNISSGNITLSAPTCTGGANHGWQYDGGGAFDGATDKVVPGDSISKVCTMTLTLTGSHIGATLGLASPDYATTNGLTDELDATADFTINGNPNAPITDPGSYTVVATVTVDFDGASATNGSKNLTAVLDDLTLTATQTHSA